MLAKTCELILLLMVKKNRDTGRINHQFHLSSIEDINICRIGSALSLFFYLKSLKKVKKKCWFCIFYLSSLIFFSIHSSIYILLTYFLNKILTKKSLIQFLHNASICTWYFLLKSNILYTYIYLNQIL